MDPPQSCSSSITINDPFPDTGGKSPAPDKSHDQAPDSPLAWLAVERDDVFYFETVTFQVCFNLSFRFEIDRDSLQIYRLRIRSSVYLKVDLKSKGVPLKLCSLFHAPRGKLLKGMMIRIPFICMESVKSTFDASFMFYIPCKYYFVLFENEDRS